MTCGDNTNNIPLGVGYNSNGRPRSLVELSSISVSSVYAGSVSSPNVYLSSVNALNSYPIIFNGTISAISYLGAGGGGVSNFVELGDVQPGLTLNPGDIVVVNPGGFLDVSSPSDIIGDVYLPLSYIGTVGSSLISATTIGDVTTSLGLGTLAFQNQTTFGALADTFSYGDASPGDILIVNPSLDGITIIPSSTFGGGGVYSALSSLTDVTFNTITDGQVVAWSAAISKWVNKTSPAGVTNFSSLTDVSTVTPTHGQVATYSTAVNKWINSSISFVGGGGTSALSSLTDVTITSPINSQIIYWASASNKWINGSAIPGQLGSQVSAVNASAFIRKQEVDSHTTNSTIHFTEASIDHRAINAIGANSHAEIDTHISDTSIHYASSVLLTPLDARYLNVSSDFGGSAANYSFSGVSAVTLSAVTLKASNYSGTGGSAVSFSANTLSASTFVLSGVTYTSFPPASAGYIIASSNASLPNARVPTNNTVIGWDLTTANQLKASAVDGGITLTKLEQIAGPYLLGLPSGSIGSPSALTPSAVIAALNLSRTLYSNNNQTEVTGTTSEVSALNYTVTSGTLKNGDALEIVIQGSIYNGFSAAVNFTPRVYWGASCVYGDVYAAGANTNYRPFEFRYSITCIGAATQKITGIQALWQNGAAGSVTGIGDFGNFNFVSIFSPTALSTVDTSSANSIAAFTIEPGTSSSNVRIKYDVVTVRLVRGIN